MWGGATLLTLAAAFNLYDIVKWLLEIHPAASVGTPIFTGENKGLTSLWLAAKASKWDIVMEMLQRNPKANVCAPSNDPLRGMTLLCYASMHQQWDIVRVILKSNPDVNVNTPSYGAEAKGKTSLWWSAYHEQWDIVEMMLESTHQAIVDAAPQEGIDAWKTPLCFAARKQQWLIFEKMLELNPSANIWTPPADSANSYESPLYYLHFHERKEILEKFGHAKSNDNTSIQPTSAPELNESNIEAAAENVSKLSRSKISLSKERPRHKQQRKSVTLKLEASDTANESPEEGIQGSIILPNETQPQMAATANKIKASKTLHRMPSSRQLKPESSSSKDLSTDQKEPSIPIENRSTHMKKSASLLTQARAYVKSKTTKKSKTKNISHTTRDAKNSSSLFEDPSTENSTAQSGDSFASSLEESLISSSESHAPKARRSAQEAEVRQSRNRALKEKRTSTSGKISNLTSPLKSDDTDKKERRSSMKLDSSAEATPPTADETSEKEKSQSSAKRLVRRMSELDLERRKSITLDENFILSTLDDLAHQGLIEYKVRKRKSTISATHKANPKIHLTLHKHSNTNTAWYNKPETIKDFTEFVKACDPTLFRV
jgi:hypothetical protein